MTKKITFAVVFVRPLKHDDDERSPFKEAKDEEKKKNVKSIWFTHPYLQFFSGVDEGHIGDLYTY